MTSSPADMASASSDIVASEKALEVPTAGDFIWSNIVYDIPLPKKQRKAAIAGAHDVEQGDTTERRQIREAAKPGDRRILSGVSGGVKRGQTMAIMGASGAGKTTLLNVLSARLDSLGTLSGEVLFMGRPRDKTTWKRTVAFVGSYGRMKRHPCHTARTDSIPPLPSDLRRFV